MAAVRYADFSTYGVEANPEFQFFQTKERLVFLGAWSFGIDAELARSYPLFDQNPGDSKRQNQDTSKANGILVTAPRKAFTIFDDARKINLFLMREESRLAGLGYTRSALVDGIRKKATAASEELDLMAAQLLTEKHRLDELQTHIENTFLPTGESEMQTTLYDLKIIDRVGPVAEYEVKALQQGDLPARFDERTVEAIHRLPACIHGLDAETHQTIIKVHGATAWPKSAHVIAQVNEMIDAAARAVTSAVASIEIVQNLPAGSLFKQIRGGDWLEKMRSSIATSTNDFDLVRLSAGKPNALECVVQDTPA